MYSLRSRGAVTLSQPLKNSIGGRKRHIASRKGGAVGTKKKKKKDAVKVEYEQDGGAVVAKESSGDKPVGAPEAVCWEPPRWREQLQNVRAMRAARDAPVDTVGCSRLADKADLPEVSFDIPLALLLTQRCTHARIHIN